MGALALIHIIAPSSAVRAEQARLCYDLGFHAEIYSNRDEFLSVAPGTGIVLADDTSQHDGVVDLMAEMERKPMWLPVIATATEPEASQIVAAMRAGALEFIAAPIDPDKFAAAVAGVEKDARAIRRVHRRAIEARGKLAGLSAREREVVDLLAGGASNKEVARVLGISPRTVEIHRANMMTKLGASNVADAVRLRLEASMGDGSRDLPPAFEGIAA